jgi:6-phosphogluconolactonase
MRARWILAGSGAVTGAAIVFACSSEPSGGGSLRKDNGAPNGSADGGLPSDGAVTVDASSDAAPVVGPLFLFVGSNDGKVRVYDVDAVTGKAVFKRESSAGTNPSFLAFDPARRRVVAVDEAGNMGQVRSFGFDPTTGALTEINAKPAGGAGSTHLSLDPTAKWVFVANYTGGNMSVLPLDPNGTLGDATDSKTSGAKSHWAGTNPSGTHVFVPALEANVVAQYTLGAANGKLTDNGTASLPPNAGPRHLAFHPNESWAYVINELAITVTAFDFDKTTGKLTTKDTLSALPGGQSTSGVSGAEIAVHPSGKHVYASTRGFNSIAHFSVNATTGALTLVENAPTGGNQPRSFGMSPEGTLLFAGNQSQNKVVGWRIDAASGGLESLGAPLDVPNPTFVGLVRIP